MLLSGSVYSNPTWRMEINVLPSVTKEVVEAARENLVIGPA